MTAMSTFYGTPGTPGSDLNPNPTNLMRYPRAIGIDGDGNLFVLEDYVVRKITPGGVATVHSRQGSGWTVNNLAVSPTGTTYLLVFTTGTGAGNTWEIWLSEGDYADFGGPVYGMIDPGSEFLAGGTAGYVDGSGAAAKFSATIHAMAANSDGCYLYDHDNHRIRLCSPGGSVSTVAGTGTAGTADGAAMSASFTDVIAMALSDTGDLYLVDQVTGGSDYAIRVLTGGSVVTLFHVTPTDVGAPGGSCTITAATWGSDAKLYVKARIGSTNGYILALPTTEHTPEEPPTIGSVSGPWTETGASPFGVVTGVVADTAGNLFASVNFVAGQTATDAHTVQQLEAVFAPAPTLPLLSTLTDTFATVDAGKWAPLGPVSTVAGALQLGSSVETGYLTSVDDYHFDEALIQLHAAGMGVQLIIEDQDNTDQLVLRVISGETWRVRADWSLGGSSGNSGDDLEYDFAEVKWLKIQRFPATSSVTFLTSADGLDWDSVETLGSVDGFMFRTVKATITGDLATSVDNFNLPAVAPGEPVDPPTEPDHIPDLFDPGATDPGSGTHPDEVDPGDPPPAPICATVLELIRAFSAAVKRPVRITGPNSIEMVDVNSPLPTGWDVADAASLYSSTTHELIAGEPVLSLDAGLLALNVSAELVNDDVRLVTSDWQLPHQLPVYGLAAGLVQRVSYRFTPNGFSGSLDFFLRPVPLIVRRS